MDLEIEGAKSAKQIYIAISVYKSKAVGRCFKNDYV